jgi:signal transduction histidine kinase
MIGLLWYQPCYAQVRLVYASDRLAITVTNDTDGHPAPSVPAQAAPAPGYGYGLIGMRERAASLGGRLSAGHRPAGGFEVVTELPLHHLTEDRA